MALFESLETINWALDRHGNCLVCIQYKTLIILIENWTMFFSRNFDANVLSAYQWLVENYQDGDRIFLFGENYIRLNVSATSPPFYLISSRHIRFFKRCIPSSCNCWDASPSEIIPVQHQVLYTYVFRLACFTRGTTSRLNCKIFLISAFLRSVDQPSP